ncbi:ornithine carbamoyltransferase [Apiotrichum porosum]|uniref:ornithine carbamoyltransferase n=1 Tax=Apiotrichum porosum TaxID=105984 RepID=A0A427XEG1_9TREE|nr:ornithine carbamoyltransferase [Apiotrichum porosum]RSH77212.1 ornithine carbamoyltransferase [Apiotrichum porosum]
MLSIVRARALAPIGPRLARAYTATAPLRMYEEEYAKPPRHVQNGERSIHHNNSRDRRRGQTTRVENVSDEYSKSEARKAFISGRIMETLKHRATAPPEHLLTLADYSVDDISSLVLSAIKFKLQFKTFGPSYIRQSLSNRTVALMFSKRSTRTRVASETSVSALGGHAMFLGSQDIQLGVNESLRDTATVVGSMTDGIMARVGGHDEVETLAKYSPVPIVNALSDLYHPTQILADLVTMVETYIPEPLVIPEAIQPTGRSWVPIKQWLDDTVNVQQLLQGKKIAWVGDTNNMTNEFLVTFPRFGMEVAVAAPKGYDAVDPRVWARVTEAGTESLITFTNTPAEAIANADIIVTDTWISMGQEEESKARLEAFTGYQLTNELIEGSGAKPDWKFMHCLPRHQDEVNDEVFYGDRSLVFPEAENRKWTIMAVFDALMGRWSRT